MKCKYVLRFFILLFAFFFQSSPVIEKLSVGGVTPNIVFAILLVFSLYLKDKEVVTYALIIGTFTDILFGKVYGITTLLMIAFVCIYILLNKYIYAESRLIVFFYCIISSFIYELILYLINMALWDGGFAFTEAISLILVKSVYNAVVILPISCCARQAWPCMRQPPSAGLPCRSSRWTEPARTAARRRGLPRR